jgi:hypothetical protein
MYAALSWQLSASSLNSSEIKGLVREALADRERQIILPHFMVVGLSSAADYDALCVALEDIARAHIGEFDYVCLRCTRQTIFRPLLSSRPGWNSEAIGEIIS